ncbi:MAG: DUF305 domain-containing protein [Blastocatellia bacterium]|nr:MAG: DUF305 domain-containing protein [Blastocatellia bacterium]
MARTLRLLVPFALIGTLAAARRQASHPQTGMPTDNSHWIQLMESMGRMHEAMSSAGPSTDADMDFVALMLPHHQGAIDMAKIELISGKDPQIRRLAQEIVAEQESEIQLMQLWRQQPKAHHDGPSREHRVDGHREH